jgi:serine/threonine protein kinase/WD40 repeat protein
MFGPYRLDELIGRGGMGEVYRGFDTVRDRPVAVKLLLESLSADEEFRDRFRREAGVTAKLRDPHVIPIHDFGEIDGRMYLDMRLADGLDLATLLEREGALPPERAVPIVEQTAAALTAAHAEGLIHRDVKPSNILVTRAGDVDFVYLVDFGIARSASSSTRSRLTLTGHTIGTMDYLAPERFLSGPTDHRVDVYSLACVLYECLTAQRPFLGEDIAVLINSHLNLPPPRPSERVAGLPTGFDAVVAWGMAKKPEERYQDARSLAAASRAVVTPGSPIPPPRASPAAATAISTSGPGAGSSAWEPTVLRSTIPEPTPRSRRNRKVVALAAVTGLAAAVGIAVATLRQAPAEHVPSPSGTPAPVVPSVPASPPLIKEGVLSGHAGAVYAVATTVLDDRPVAISAGADRTLRVWDLGTDQQLGALMTGHTGEVDAVAAGSLDGVPIAVSGSDDRTVRLWDLRTHQQLGAPMTGHTDWVRAVATTMLDGVPVAVSGGDDRTVRLWDLRTHQQLGAPMTGHTDVIESLTTTVLDGLPVAISSGWDNTMRVWDLRTHQQLGGPLVDNTVVSDAAVSTVNGQPVVVSVDDAGAVRLWDLRTYQQLGAPLTGHTGEVWDVTATMIDGAPVAISAGTDHTLRIWDLNTRQQLGAPLIGHAAEVDDVTTIALDGQHPVAVSAGRDATLRVWDLTERAGR